MKKDEKNRALFRRHLARAQGMHLVTHHLEEIEWIYEALPELRPKKEQPPSPGPDIKKIRDTQSEQSKKKTASKKIIRSTAYRKAVSKRMKKHWAERRAATKKATK